MNYATRTIKRSILFVQILSFYIFTDTLAAIHSVITDNTNHILIIKGTDLANSNFIVAGNSVNSIHISDNEQHISFSEIEPIVRFEGSYNIISSGSVFSMYSETAIIAPQPPPVSTNCPCITGWETSGIPQDNFTWCYYGFDQTQQWIYGSRDNYFISAAFDPNNIFFDPLDVGNSISFCALNDGTGWAVAEPIASQEQLNNCEDWLWKQICL